MDNFELIENGLPSYMFTSIRFGILPHMYETLRYEKERAQERVVQLFKLRGIEVKHTIVRNGITYYSNIPEEYDLEKDYYAKGVINKSDLIHNEFYYGIWGDVHLAKWNARYDCFEFCRMYTGNLHEPTFIPSIEKFIESDSEETCVLNGRTYKGNDFTFNISHIEDDNKTQAVFLPIKQATKEEVRKEYHL